MQRLIELLDSAAASSTFDIGHTKPEDDGFVTYYGQRPDEVLTAQQLRDLIERRTWQDREHKMANRARMSVPSSSLAQVADYVRAELAHCVDSSKDRIGHAFPGRGSSGTLTVQADGVVSHTSTSQVSDLAESLVRGAAFLGSARVAELLTGWADGDPAAFKTRVLLNAKGILAEPLSPVGGIRIESLPLSTRQFTFFLPTTKGRTIGDYLARMVITIDHTTAPALFHPSNTDQVRTTRATAMPGIDATTVCTALSLEADIHADIAFFWTDFGELVAFGSGHENAIRSFGQQHYRSHSYTNATIRPESHPDGPSIELAEDWTLEIEEAELGRTLDALAADCSHQLRIAASRWQSTKNTRASLEDRFIDLRIALESLYLRDFGNEMSQEMRFRLALFAAWHLGADHEERKTIRKKFRDAYDTASKAVHLGHVESTQQNRDLLSDAQALCRRGALRLLKDGEPQDWGNLVLGPDE
ncbi:hypothetical protein [Candidatus Poriferisocius sp.]|uniref:hypothetical protein n=1 Tax=Candidatus Poriferisocius sp. TaxID=3101276 RepID=UPI003B011587